MRGTPLLAVEDLDVAYGDFQVLWGAAMQVGEGEIVAVLGPNGAGKSRFFFKLSFQTITCSFAKFHAAAGKLCKIIATYKFIA
jgi:ABC-type Mn2+/Zn2+ transport system ATPase subunit